MQQAVLKLTVKPSNRQTSNFSGKRQPQMVVFSYVVFVMIAVIAMVQVPTIALIINFTLQMLGTKTLFSISEKTMFEKRVFLIRSIDINYHYYSLLFCCDKRFHVLKFVEMVK